MNKLMDISFDKLIEVLSSQEIFNDELIICDIDAAVTPRHDREPPPVRFDAWIFCLVLNGEASMNIDYITYHLQKGTLLMIGDLHVMYDARNSPDFKCHMMVMTKDYAFPIVDEIRRINTVPLDFKPYRPMIKLDEEEMSLFTEIIGKIRRYIKADNHFFQSLIIKNEVSNFVGEFGNIILSRGKNKSTDLTLNHREEVIRNFVRLLLYNCKTQHEVSFYADELCMSPENLSRILKSFRGKTANKWISDALIVEAKKMLNNKEINIQQVADELNFGDQSSFGKFFKKHTGYTPIAYKNKMTSGEIKPNKM